MTQRRVYRQIIIRYVTVPSEDDDLDAGLDFIYQCLGLGDERDEVGKTVFRALVKASRQGSGISSRDIAQLGQVTQAAIIYHLNQFKRSGLVVKEGRNYYLRGHTLENTLEEMESDMSRRFERMKKIAKRIDGYFP
jgi:predicted transcriptional regulator